MIPFAPLMPALNGTSRWIIKACIILSAIAIASLVAYNKGQALGVESMRAPLAEEKAQHQKDLADHARILREYAESAAHVAVLARSAQTTFVQDRVEADRTHDQELANAIARKDRLIAGYRSRAVQLQPWWECPSVLPAAGGVLGAGTAGGGPGADAAAELRAAGHAENVYQFALADTWIRRLQAEVTATRKACGVPNETAHAGAGQESGPQAEPR